MAAGDIKLTLTISTTAVKVQDATAGTISNPATAGIVTGA